MALFCPNINSPEYKKLLSAVDGNSNLAYYYWNKFEGNLPNDFYTNTQQVDTQEVVIEQEQRKGISGDTLIATNPFARQYLVAKQYVYKGEGKAKNTKPEEEIITDKKIKYIEKALNCPVIRDNTIHSVGLVTKEDGKVIIKINPDKINRSTLFHEFAHIFIDTIGLKNKDVQSLLAVLRKTSLARSIEEMYADKDQETRDKELLAEAMGREADDIFTEDQYISKNSFNRLIDKIFKWLQEKFGLRTPDELRQLTRLFLTTEIKIDPTKIGEYQQRDKEAERKENIIKEQKKVLTNIINSLKTKAKLMQKKNVNAESVKRLEGVAVKLAQYQDLKGIADYVETAYNMSKSIAGTIAAFKEPDADKVALFSIKNLEEYLSAFALVDDVIALASKYNEIKEEFTAARTTIEGGKTVDLPTIMQYLEEIKLVRIQAQNDIRYLKTEALVEKLTPYFHKFKELFIKKKEFDLMRAVTQADYLKNNPDKKATDYQKYIQEQVNIAVSESTDEIERGEEEMIRELLGTAAADVGWADMLLASQAKVGDPLIETAVTMLDVEDYKIHKRIVEETRRAWFDIYQAFDKEKPTNDTVKKYDEMLENEIAVDDKGNIVIENGKPKLTGKKSNALVGEFYYSFYETLNKLQKEAYSIEDEATRKKALDEFKAWKAKNIARTLTDGTIIPAKQWENPQYKKLRELRDKGSAIWKMYEYISSINKEADNKLGHSALGQRLPAITRTATESLFNSGILATIKTGFKNTFIAQNDDNTFGNAQDQQDAELRAKWKQYVPVAAGEAGTEKHYVPILYRDKLKNPSEQSYDLLTMTLMNLKTSLDYKAKLNILADVESLRDLVAERKVQQKDVRGRTKVKKDSDGNIIPITTSGAESKALKVLDSIIEDRVYGIKMVGSPQINKLAHKLSGWTSDLSQIGNYLSSLRNMNQQHVVLWMENTAGNRIDKGSVGKAETRYVKELPKALMDLGKVLPTSLNNLLIERYNATQEFTHIMPFVQDTKLKQAGYNSLYLLNNIPDHMTYSKLMWAIMYSTPVLDATGKESTLAEAWEVKNNKLVVKDGWTTIDKKSIANLDFEVTKKITDIGEDLFGTKNPLHKPMIKRYAAGTLAMTMHSWIYGPLNRRFKGIATVRPKEWVEKNGIKLPDFEDVQNAEGMYAAMYTYIRMITSNLKALGWQVFKHGYNNLTPRQQADVRRTIVELGTAMLGFFVAGLLKDLGEDEPKDSATRAAAYNAAYLSRALYAELTFYVNPMEYARLLKNPVIPLSTVTKFITFGSQVLTDPTERYESGRRAGDLKAVKYFSDIAGVGYRAFSRDIEELLDFMYKY